MKKLLFLLFPIISFAQNTKQIEALKLQNQFRQYNFVDSLKYCDTLALKAQKWAEHLALIDEIKISEDIFGENIYRIDKIAETISIKFNPFLDASIFWVINIDKTMLAQVIDHSANKVGFGFAENENRYYIVAKYNNIIQ